MSKIKVRQVASFEKIGKDGKKIFTKGYNNKVIDQLMNDLKLPRFDATVFAYLFCKYLENVENPVYIKSLREELSLSASKFYRIMNSVSSLITCGYLIPEKGKSKDSNLLIPNVIIDNFIAHELIYGKELMNEYNLKDRNGIFSYLELIFGLLKDSKSSFKKSCDEITKLSKKIGHLKPFHLLDKMNSLQEVVFSLFVLLNMAKSNFEVDYIEFMKDHNFGFEDRQELLKVLTLKKFTLARKHLVKNIENGLFLTGVLCDRDKQNYVASGESGKYEIRKKFVSESINHMKNNSEEHELFFRDEETEEMNKLINMLDHNRFHSIKKKLRGSFSQTGMIFLFYGDPGTGKTASAYNIAKKTGREILSVNIAEAMGNGLVGEWEKQIKKIFTEYRRALRVFKYEPILLFNEADALITSRIEVRRTVDQAMNATQNILLDELENFKGILIATTNSNYSFDEAFDRRFLFKLKFSAPDEKTRMAIWMSKLPELSESNIIRLSRYELKGGDIDSIVRRHTINTVISNRGIDIDELESLARNESGYRYKNSNRRLGFINNESAIA